MLEIRYVWEWPVRITHWINALCVVTLSVTGYFIGDPVSAAPETTGYVMGWTRFIHFTAAYLFLTSMIVRVIYLFIGNHHASWRAFLPFLTAEGRANARKMFSYYTFIGKKISYEVGHNAMAAMAYAGIFAIFVFQILSGFALYGQSAPGGFWDSLLGWMLPLFGNQTLRFSHHFIMWLLLGFIINHIYSAWLMDIKERNGTISGIFGGYKYIEPRDL